MKYKTTSDAMAKNMVSSRGMKKNILSALLIMNDRR